MGNWLSQNLPKWGAGYTQRRDNNEQRHARRAMVTLEERFPATNHQHNQRR
jgi:hypothetical protein